MLSQILGTLFTVSRPHPWGGAANVRYGRNSGRRHRHADRSPGLSMKAAIMSVAVIAGVGPVQAQAFLTGSGTHLPLGSIVGPSSTPEPGLGAAYTETPFTSFTGTWGASVLPAWQGTFTGTGPIPSLDSRPSGTSLYNFSGLATGVLPVGTYIVLGDIDSGSGVEHVTLKAFDSGGAPLITWLNSPPAVVRGIGSGGGGIPVSADLPGWDWNATTFEYTFDGTTVGGNPTVAFYLNNNAAIGSLSVTRDNSFSNFAVAAPSAVPEPGEYAAVAGLALVGFGLWRRARRQAAPLPVNSGMATPAA